MTPFHDKDYVPEAFDVRVSELLLATADGGDALISDSVPEVLRLLPEHLKMDVVFVSEFVDGRRIFRRLQAAADQMLIAVNQSAPLEATYCQRVVDGRMPRLVHDVARFLMSICCFDGGSLQKRLTWASHRNGGDRNHLAIMRAPKNFAPSSVQ